MTNAQAFHQGLRYNRWFVLGIGDTPGCRLDAISTVLTHPRCKLGKVEVVDVNEVWEVVAVMVKFS